MGCVGASDCGARGGSSCALCVPGASGVFMYLVSAPPTSSVGRGGSTPRVAPHISSVCRAKSGSSGSVSYLLRFSAITDIFTKHTRVRFTTILLFDDLVFHPRPTPFTLEQTKRAQACRLRAQAQDEIDGRRIKSQTHIRLRRLRLCGTRVRMIDRKQLLAARAHTSLRREQLCGRTLVSRQRIGRDVWQTIDRRCQIIISADEAATLSRCNSPRVRQHLF